jgi:hypothetical protein
VTFLRLALSFALLGWFTPLQAGEPLYVWADQLQLRKAPSSGAAVLETLPYGTPVGRLKVISSKPYEEPIFAAFSIPDGRTMISRMAQPVTPGFSLKGQWVRVKSPKGTHGFVPSPWLLPFPPALDEENLSGYCSRVLGVGELEEPGITGQTPAVEANAEDSEMGGSEKTRLPMLRSLEAAYVISRHFYFREMKPCLDPEESMNWLLSHEPGKSLCFRTNEVSSVYLTIDGDGGTIDWGWAD